MVSVCMQACALASKMAHSTAQPEQPTTSEQFAEEPTTPEQPTTTKPEQPTTEQSPQPNGACSIDGEKVDEDIQPDLQDWHSSTADSDTSSVSLDIGDDMLQAAVPYDWTMGRGIRRDFEFDLSKLVYPLYSSKYYGHVKNATGCCVDRWLRFANRHRTIKDHTTQSYYSRYNTEVYLFKHYDQLCYRAKRWLLNDNVDECAECLNGTDGYLCKEHFAAWLTIQALCMRFDTVPTVRLVKHQPSHNSLPPTRYPICPSVIVRGPAKLRHALYAHFEGLGQSMINPTADSWLKAIEPTECAFKTVVLMLCWDHTTLKLDVDWMRKFPKRVNSHDALIIECNEENVGSKVHDAMVDLDRCTDAWDGLRE